MAVRAGWGCILSCDVGSNHAACLRASTDSAGGYDGMLGTALWRAPVGRDDLGDDRLTVVVVVNW